MTHDTFASSPPDGAWDELNKSAGERVQQLREAAGLTPSDLMRQLAERGIKLQVTEILRTEKGSRPLRLHEAAAIAGMFAIEMSGLLEGTEDIDLATLEVQQQDALAAIVERQNANAERLAKMRQLDSEIRQAGGEIDHYQVVVHNMERRIANLRDGEEPEDAPNDCGYEEI